MDAEDNQLKIFSYNALQEELRHLGKSEKKIWVMNNNKCLKRFSFYKSMDYNRILDENVKKKS